jgi:hypothetical protein
VHQVDVVRDLESLTTLVARIGDDVGRIKAESRNLALLESAGIDFMNPVS